MTNDDNLQLRILEKHEIQCSDVEELLSDYIDAELIPTLHVRVGHHIANCECCAQAEDEIREIIKMASLLKPPPMPKEAQRRLRDNLNKRLGLSL